MNFKGILIATLLVAGLSLTSCGDQYQKLLKSSDYALKEQRAMEYYNEGDYIKAIPLIEELIQVHRGIKSVEDYYFYYPYCYYGQSNYEFAGYYFKSFIDTYPKSARAEDARWMMAICEYEMSPIESLDQLNTGKAIEAFQLFANSYPNSDRIEDCNQIIDELRKKLQDKALKGALLYYDIRDYRAASIAMVNLLNDFPETEEHERVRYLIVKSKHLYADNSIRIKQEERYQSTVDSYEEFIDRYPQSEYLREVEKLYINSLEQLDKLKFKQ